MKAMLKKDKKGMGLVTGLIAGVGGLIITVIVSLLIVDTLFGAGLISDNERGGYNATDDMIKNYTNGIGDVSEKIPTILLISAVVILFGAIVILVSRSKSMTGGGGL